MVYLDTIYPGPKLKPG